MVVRIAQYDPRWPRQFDELARALRSALGEGAGQIDHIGSTAVPGLAAKPIIDVQISVGGFGDFDSLRSAIEALGYTWHPDNPDRRKRFFTLVEQGRRVAHLHVREQGGFSQQAALLFRDYLRADEAARCEYEAEKRRLATREWESGYDYADAKGDVVWRLLSEADRWAWGAGEGEE